MILHGMWNLLRQVAHELLIRIGDKADRFVLDMHTPIDLIDAQGHVLAFVCTACSDHPEWPCQPAAEAVDRMHTRQSS